LRGQQNRPGDHNIVKDITKVAEVMGKPKKLQIHNTEEREDQLRIEISGYVETNEERSLHKSSQNNGGYNIQYMY
jgi:hypothetical protein